MKPLVPVELRNEYVHLTPLSRDHAAAYFEIGREPRIWTYLPPSPFETLADAERWIDFMLARSHYSMTFSVYDIASAALAGTSSFLNVDADHSKLEIGFTWYGVAFQRTHVNTATKLALLTHAFEALGTGRVQLQTDERNVASQRAIERVGAIKEGVLRKHKTYPDGYVRNTVVYSILDDEWPGVRRRLRALLDGVAEESSQAQTKESE